MKVSTIGFVDCIVVSSTPQKEEYKVIRDFLNLIKD